MPRTEIRHITVGSLAKIYAAIMVVMTIVFGWPVLFLGAVAPGAGIGTFLVMILFSIFGGLIAGALTAFVYNIVAGVVGGLEIEVDWNGESGPPMQSEPATMS